LSEKAAASGHLMCLTFAEGCGFPWKRIIRARVAKNEINYRKNTRFRSFDNVVCKKDARNGQLECLVYLHDNGCLWDEDTCRANAESEHIDLMRYAHENGCPWDENTCPTAVQKSASWTCCGTPMKTVARGTITHVPWPQNLGILICCGMPMNGVARGTNLRVILPRKTDKARVWKMDAWRLRYPCKKGQNCKNDKNYKNSTSLKLKNFFL